MSYIKTTTQPGYSQTETVITDPENNLKMNSTLDVDIDGNGSIDNRDFSVFSYDAMGQLISQYTSFDRDVDGVVDFERFSSWVWNTDGTLDLEETHSPDWNQDGAPDDQSIRALTYDASGHVTKDEKLWYYDGAPSNDYRVVETTYTADGQPDVTTIDDSMFLDFVIAEDRNYDALGRITEIQRMDPFDYGDEAFHPEESWTYNPDGSVTYSNVTGQTPYGNFAELTTKLSFVTPTQTKELIEGRDGNGAVVFRMQHEEWYSKIHPGELTTVLDSFDVNLDGKFNPGGNRGDYRTKEVLKYSDFDLDGNRDVVYHTVDIGLDKVIDFQMEITPIDLIIA